MEKILAQYYIKQFTLRNDLELILSGVKEGVSVIIDSNTSVLVTKYSPSILALRATVFRRSNYPRDIRFEPYELGIRIGLRNVSTQTEETERPRKVRK